MTPELSKALARLVNRMADYWMETVLVVVLAGMWVATIVIVWASGGAR